MDKNKSDSTISGDSATGVSAEAEQQGRPPASATTPRLIIGIGASAGGLEALQGFFNNCSPDLDVAYIVVLHLSPDFKSLIDQLLSNCTTMPVTVVKDSEVVNSNQVYIIPPKKSMIIAEARLILSDRAPQPDLSLPIDTFFRSLAQDQQSRCAGVILSGTGSDGLRGVKAINEVGGLIIVQDPNEAKFDGMPNAALRSGCVDHMISVAEMPSCIAGHLQSYTAISQSNRTDQHAEASDVVLSKICALIQKYVNINLNDYKSSTIGRRVDKRASLLHLNSWTAYYDYLLESPDERQGLGREILIGVTRFFRDTDAFELLQKNVIPQILQNTPEDEVVRVWCAGCSTGEEAYSLAILFDEAMQSSNTYRKIKVFATDIDINSINEASVGVYGAEIESDVSPERLKQYFVQVADGRYQIDTRIRQTTVFAVQNLISDPPFSNMSLVTCRNLLIYLQIDSQRRVMQLLNFALRLNCHLMLGPSESISPDLEDCYKVIDRRSKLFQKVKSVKLPLSHQLEMKEKPAASAHEVQQVLYHKYTMPKRLSDSLSPIFKKLVEDYAPPTLICNYELEIIYSIGDCSPYTRKMQPGASSLSINSILEESILIAVTTAMQKAKREKSAIMYTGVALEGDIRPRMIDLAVTPMQPAPNLESFLSVSFIETELVTPNTVSAIPFDEKQTFQNRLQDLEYELQETQSRLAAAIEEIETSNEELQSTNEELMAANEELQTTNEELQSVNEELYSVNTEYQHKMIVLEQANSDIENLLHNSHLNLLVLNRDLTIRRFTPGVAEYFSIIEDDLQRSIDHITNRIENDLISDCKIVMDDGQALQREYNTTDGRLLLARITPYISLAKSLDGVVLSLLDITQTELLKTERKTLRDLADDLNQEFKALYKNMHPLISRSAPATLKILLVEDEEDDFALINKQILKIENFQADLDHATSVENALYDVNNTNYDVILLDYYIGEKTADQLLAMLAKLSSSPPVILLTTELDKEKKKSLLKHGVYDFISKTNISAEIIECTLRLTLHNKAIEAYLEKIGV